MEEILHLIYFHPDKENGYGATQEGRLQIRLGEQVLDPSKVVIIEKGLTQQRASELERELQLRDGYPVDAKPYSYVINVMQPKSNTPQAIKKMLANTDQKAKGRKISKTLTGRVLSDEHKNRIRQQRLGKVTPEETKRKISETLKKWTGDRGVSKRKRPIIQLDLNYNPVKVWQCAKEVSQTIPNFWESPIGDRANGKTDKPYKGYYWKYA